MRTKHILGLVMAAVLAVPQTGRTQEANPPEMAPLQSVATWDIDPADVGTFMQAVVKVVQAAREANLAPEYGWSLWQNMYSVTLVSPFNRAELDDPQDWMNQFAGTPGQATLMEAFQEMEGVQFLSTVQEIHQGMPAWSYMPEGMTTPPMAFVRVNEFWTKSGQANDQAWNALIADFVEFFGNIEYPYPIWGSMVRFGENRTTFVTAYDDPGEYFGTNSVEALAERKGMLSEWQELLTRLSQVTRKAEVGDYTYLPDQSYTP